MFASWLAVNPASRPMRSCCGEFSTSPRVSTFLSVVRRYYASVRHVSGSAILSSDFASLNVPPCEDERYQICSFISRAQESVVRSTSVQDVLAGSVRLPLLVGNTSWVCCSPTHARSPCSRHKTLDLTPDSTLPFLNLFNLVTVNNVYSLNALLHICGINTYEACLIKFLICQ